MNIPISATFYHLTQILLQKKSILNNININDYKVYYIVRINTLLYQIDNLNVSFQQISILNNNSKRLKCIKIYLALDKKQKIQLPKVQYKPIDDVNNSYLSLLID